MEEPKEAETRAAGAMLAEVEMAVARQAVAIAVAKLVVAAWVETMETASTVVVKEERMQSVSSNFQMETQQILE